MQPPMTPPPRRRRRFWLIFAISAGVLVLACVTCGLIGALAPKQPQAAAALPTATLAAQQTVTHVATSTLAPTATATPKPAPTLAATPTPRPTVAPTQAPTPVPTQAPRPTATPRTGVNGNPWGYDFNQGNLIYAPNAAFCDYFACVSTFWKDTNGYVAECGNGEYTHSAGVSGACSRDGGVARTLYSHS